MGLLNTLTFDGKPLSDFKAFISGSGVFNSPARIGEMVHIPGRNGSIWMDEGCFENIEITYPAFIGTQDEEEFRTKLRDLRTWLNSRSDYCRLEDTYHPDEYRTAAFRSAIETDPKVYNRAGSFEIRFDAKPQRFLKSGDEPIILNQSAIIYNPTLFNSKPLIKVVGNGTVKMEPYEFIVSDNDSELWIDSEIDETYILIRTLYNLTDENGTVITDENGEPIQVSKEATPVYSGAKVQFVDYNYPEIVPGYVPVKISSGITELTIIPRWWYL